MSGSFDERRKSFEGKWAHDEDLKFKVMARRDRLLGQWAAEQMGLKGAEMEAYAKTVVQAEFAGPGAHDIAKKLRADLAAKNVKLSDHAIQRKMDELLALAGEQVLSERKS